MTVVIIMVEAARYGVELYWLEPGLEEELHTRKLYDILQNDNSLKENGFRCVFFKATSTESILTPGRIFVRVLEPGLTSTADSRRAGLCILECACRNVRGARGALAKEIGTGIDVTPQDNRKLKQVSFRLRDSAWYCFIDSTRAPPMLDLLMVDNEPTLKHEEKTYERQSGENDCRGLSSDNPIDCFSSSDDSMQDFIASDSESDFEQSWTYKDIKSELYRSRCVHCNGLGDELVKPEQFWLSDQSSTTDIDYPSGSSSDSSDDTSEYTLGSTDSELSLPELD